MFLKRHNVVAFILLFIAAFCWTLGQQMLNNIIEEDDNTDETTVSITMMETGDPTTTSPEESLESDIIDQPFSDIDLTQSKTFSTTEKKNYLSERMLGSILSLISVVVAFIAIVVLFQTMPFFGPDGVSLILALLAMVYNATFYTEYTQSSMINILRVFSRIISIFLVLLNVRELIGWIRAKFSVSWCLVHRITKRCTIPQISLLIFAGWIVIPWIVLLCFFGIFLDANFIYEALWFIVFEFMAVSVIGFLCLWKYGTDLNHFKKQLNNYQKGKPITVGDGTFAQTEAQLLDVQVQHEEAVRTAVTSEQFKVELISNVSHDLRTPLTSIIGYSELLQNEILSPKGQEQLRYLHQKAVYMNDLVESLFELTKVSSGAIESKKDQIDLIRLLEQTIGLFDDQLVNSGLTVKRSYCSETLPVITDGARMHQVFANLLGNAIKYALTGTRIYLEVKETENNYFIRMVNTASYEMDFKPDEIIERFARGDKSRSTKGSGLGLAIAQTYTESVGGLFRVLVDGDQFGAIVELPKIERNL